MLQQYGFDDDDDEDEEEEEEEEGCDGCEDDRYCDKKVGDDNCDDDMFKDEGDKGSRMKSVIVDLLCSSFNDYFDLDIFDLQLVNISSCLDKIMVVLIRVRLKMEKFIDLSIL